MRAPLRTAGLVAALAIGPLLLTSAVPLGAATLFVAPSSPWATGGQPVTALPSDPPPGALGADKAVRELREKNYLDVDPSGVVRGVTAPPGQSLGPNADAFVTRYAGAFGLSKGHTLSRAAVTSLGGDSVIRYQQMAGGLPILGGQVLVTTAPDGSVRSAITGTSRLKPIGAAKVDAATAAAKALAAAAQKYEIEQDATATASLWLYDASTNTPRARPELRPTYWVKVVAGEEELASVLVDGIDGSVKLVASEHQTWKSRLVCDLANTRVNLNLRSQYLCQTGSALAGQPAARAEGAPPSSVPDVNAAYDRLGVAFDYYLTNFGIDSFDGHGASIRATVRACHLTDPCPFPNAFWEGSQFVFGDGWAVDDVVWHEYTHAVTQYSSDLFYWFESGAINEALSDIFGQFIDLQTPADDAGGNRWKLGEDLAVGALRDMANPPLYGDPAVYHDAYWDYDWDLSDNGGVHADSGVANHIAAMLYDGTTGVPALGATKSAQLWWRVMHILPSGADYRTLGVALKAACRQFIGKLGFTSADCGGVEQAISLAQLFPGRSQAPLCPASPYQAATDVFFDGMENGSDNWVRSSTTYWDFIPSVNTPFAYAASGRGSVNGWTPSSAGNGQTIEMKNPVTVPVGKPAYIAFDQSLIKDPSAFGFGIDMFINAGGGWQPLTGFTGPIPSNTNRIDYTSIGFDALRAPLNAYAGQSVRVKFQLATPNGLSVDWYLDNFRIYTCDPDQPGQPQDAFAYLNGTDLALDWSRTGYFAGATTYDDYHYELTYSPTIPGAPATFRGSGVGDRFTLSVPGADPNQTYTITMRVKMDTGAGLYGPQITLVVSPFPPTSCQTDKPRPLALPSIGSLSRRLPSGPCPVIIPRRV